MGTAETQRKSIWSYYLHETAYTWKHHLGYFSLGLLAAGTKKTLWVKDVSSSPLETTCIRSSCDSYSYPWALMSWSHEHCWKLCAVVLSECFFAHPVSSLRNLWWCTSSHKRTTPATESCLRSIWSHCTWSEVRPGQTWFLVPHHRPHASQPAAPKVIMGVERAHLCNTYTG